MSWVARTASRPVTELMLISRPPGGYRDDLTVASTPRPRRGLPRLSSRGSAGQGRVTSSPRSARPGASSPPGTGRSGR